MANIIANMVYISPYSEQLVSKRFGDCTVYQSNATFLFYVTLLLSNIKEYKYY